MVEIVLPCPLIVSSQASDFKGSPGSIPPVSSLLYTDEFCPNSFRKFRALGDPVCDRVISHMHSTRGLTNIKNLLKAVQKRAAEEERGGETNGIYSSFLRDANSIPTWVDPAQIKAGQQIQARYRSYASACCNHLVYICASGTRCKWD